LSSPELPVDGKGDAAPDPAPLAAPVCETDAGAATLPVSPAHPDIPRLTAETANVKVALAHRGMFNWKFSKYSLLSKYRAALYPPSFVGPQLLADHSTLHGASRWGPTRTSGLPSRETRAIAP
jgi:hypothetical protein